MTGNKRGVATQIQAEEKRAGFTHCYGHALLGLPSSNQRYAASLWNWLLKFVS